MGEPHLYLIPTENAAALWHLAEPFIEKAVMRTDSLVSAETHRQGVESGDKQLWLAWSDDKCWGAGVTEIINGTCFIWAFGGDDVREHLPSLHKDLERWARSQGCDGFHFYGRFGWIRALKDIGYKRRLVVMHKGL